MPTRSPARIATAAFVLVATAGGAGGTQSHDDVATARTVGTVEAVDTRAREFRLITGIGHSLRVTLVHAPATCRIVLDEDRARFEELRRGLIVVVRYRELSGRCEAESIETLGTPREPRPR